MWNKLPECCCNSLTESKPVTYEKVNLSYWDDVVIRCNGKWNSYYDWYASFYDWEYWTVINICQDYSTEGKFLYSVKLDTELDGNIIWLPAEYLISIYEVDDEYEDDDEYEEEYDDEEDDDEEDIEWPIDIDTFIQVTKKVSEEEIKKYRDTDSSKYRWAKLMLQAMHLAEKVLKND